MPLKQMISSYEREFKDKFTHYLNYYKTFDNINDAITSATLAKLHNGKKYSHQKRINNQILVSVKDKLLEKAYTIEKCSKFDELFKIVEDTAEKGFGELAIYDTALRIGAYLDIYPDKVYMHAGTRIGAIAIGLDPSIKSINPSNIGIEFNNLKAHEIEDLLCINKKRLKKKGFQKKINSQK